MSRPDFLRAGSLWRYRLKAKLKRYRGTFDRLTRAWPQGRAWLGRTIARLRFGLLRLKAKLQRRIPHAQYDAGRAALTIDRPDLAEVYFKRALQGWPDCGLFHMSLGDALKRQSRWQEASASYHRAIATETANDTTMTWAYHNLGEVEAHQQHWELAIAAYEISAERQPQFFYAHHNLARACEQAGRFDRARAALERAIALNPDSARLLRDLAQLCTRCGNPEGVRSALERAIALEPDRFQPYFDLAGVLRNLGEMERAADTYLQSLDRDPNFSWWYHYYFWQCLKNTERLDAAIEIFQRQTREVPDRPAPYLNLGEAFVHRDRIPDSLEPYRQGLKQKIQKAKPFYPIEQWDDDRVFGPNFIILGAQKAGTSSLFEYATQHPQILPPLRKELEFWSMRMRRGLDWYLSQFPAIPADVEMAFLTGEACPGYFDCDRAASRLRAEFPETKLIVILRDPVERAYSHYNHWVRRHQETQDFETAIRANLDRLTADGAIDDRDLWNVPHDYLARGAYVVFLKHWMSAFPREQFLILSNDDLSAQPQQTLGTLFDFLDLPDFGITADVRYNVGAYSPISATTRDLLEEFYAPYDRELERFLGRSFAWSKRRAASS